MSRVHIIVDLHSCDPCNNKIMNFFLIKKSFGPANGGYVLFFFNLIFILLIWIFVSLPFCINFISFQFHPSIQIYSILIFFNFILILFIFLVLLLKLFFFSISPFNQRFIVFISFIFYFYPLSSHYYFFGSFHIILFFFSIS
jgi:hypothetical protein